MSIPTLTRHADIAQHDGAEVIVEGVYTLVDVRMRATPPSVYAGNAAVALDGGRVLLEPVWSAEAIRPEPELALAGRRVRARGRLHLRAPEPPEPAANLLVPCLHPVISIEPIE